MCHETWQKPSVCITFVCLRCATFDRQSLPLAALLHCLCLEDICRFTWLTAAVEVLRCHTELVVLARRQTLNRRKREPSNTNIMVSVSTKLSKYFIHELNCICVSLTVGKLNQERGRILVVLLSVSEDWQ